MFIFFDQITHFHRITKQKLRFPIKIVLKKLRFPMESENLAYLSIKSVSLSSHPNLEF